MRLHVLPLEISWQLRPGYLQPCSKEEVNLCVYLGSAETVPGKVKSSQCNGKPPDVPSARGAELNLVQPVVSLCSLPV